MACTLTLMNTITFCSTLIKNQRLNVNGLEPGLSFGNIILQRMLGAPFIWRFNRGTLTIPISQAGGTDYTVSVASLGRIETQWLTNAAGAVIDLGGEVEMAKVSSVRRPQKVAPVYDDNNGNVTFRFSAISDMSYTAWFDYQKKAPLMTSWASGWTPIPDEFSYIFNKGYLALSAPLVNDARFTIWEKDFIGALLETQDGLDEQAKNNFVARWMSDARYIMRSQASVQAGTAGRGQ